MKGEEVKQYLTKTGETIYILQIAGEKRRNSIGPRHLSLRKHG